MLRALIGGGRSSSDLRSSTGSSSGKKKSSSSSVSSSSSRRKKTDSSSKSSKSSSSRGDDRDRGLGDLSTYPSSSSGRRRYASSAAGDSVASGSRSARRRDREHWPESDPEPEPEPIPRALDDDDENDRKGDGRRTQPGDPGYLPPLATGALPPAATTANQFAADIASPGFSQFPMQHDNNPNYNNAPGPLPPSMMPSPHDPVSPATYDPHVPQQFPGQFPAYSAEPYRPSNPAGEAADYYGDQGQSIQEQPGVRPNPPAIIPNPDPHLMPASPIANPPEEPSSMGEVGAAADYYGGGDGPEMNGQTSQEPAPKPPKPSKPSKPSGLTGVPDTPDGIPSGMATHGSSESSSVPPLTPMTPGTADPQSATFPQDSFPHSHTIGPGIGAAAGAAAAAGYMAHHHHQSSSSPEHPLQSPYNMQNHEPYTPNGLDQPNPSIYPPHPNPAFNDGYPAHPSYPHPAPFQSGGLAFQQRQRNPLDKFIDFWRDPEGAGEFEEYTEAIGICKYCFEPGTTSRDAPRKHNYRRRRRSSDRYSNGSKVDKSARYSSSSDDESRRRSGSSKKSWLGGILSGYAVKSILDNKDFEDSYNVRQSRVSSPRVQSSDSESDSDGKGRTSRGAYRRSPRSRSPRTERGSYSDSKRNKYEGRRRSRSRSRSLDGHSAVRDAAIGAAVGSALSQSKSIRSPKDRAKGRISSNDSSSSSYFDISQPERKSVNGGLGSFFTSSSENRKKRKPRRSKSLFSLQNSSSSSLDNDLAFGSGFARKPSKSQKKKGKDKSRGQDENVDAKLLGLSAAATALAASPHGHGRRSGEVLAGKDSRNRRVDYASPATNDDDWEDLGSDDESSSVSSALAFGGSSEDSSDSGTSKWNWRWGSKKDKKKNKKDSDHFPTGPALAAGAGAAALGTAALASGYRKDRNHSGSSSGGSPQSLQRVVPIPTSDPSRFDAVAAQPTFVRPGPIPLQQPQPVMPVSQAVYTSQGDSIPAYSAPAGPPFFGAPVPRDGGRWDSRNEVYPERTHRRRDSSPVYHPEPFQGSTISSFKRRSMPRDTASVQFDLTQEQADKERRADRRERRKRDSSGDQGIQLHDREYEDEESSRRERRRRERRSSDYDDSLFSRSSTSRRDSPDRERRRRDDDREKDSSSWIGPAAAVGTVGAAAAAASAMSRRSSEDASERREKRRAERRRTSSEQGSETSGHSRAEPSAVHVEDATPIDNQPSPSAGKYSPSWMDRQRPEYDNYAAFFAPEGLQYSPDPNSHAQRPERFAMPTIDEGEPVTAPYAPALPQQHPYPNYGGFPWPVPQLNLIEPTPPHSQNGSVRDIASPIPPPPEPSYREAPSPRRQTTRSRVSWGKSQTHEYEDHPERDSVNHDVAREIPRDVAAKDSPIGNDIEFDAVVAAGMASAGFNPMMVTENSKYQSPPESGLDRQQAWEGPAQPHGFVEGEVDTPGADGQDSFAPDYVSRDQKGASDVEHQRSLTREALEQPPKDQPFREISLKEEPTSLEEDMPSMPGSFDPVEPTEADEPKPRSVVSEGGEKHKKRRNKKRSSKGSTEFDDSASVNSSPAWISDERQGKSRREERRGERDSAGGHDKDLKKDILPYAGALALPFAMAALDSRPRSRSASPPASAKTVDPGTGSQSRPSSPEMISNNERRRADSNSSRRSVSFHESPTAVPLHFRYPGASPGGTQRSPSGGSPGAGVTAQSPGSPTQKRPRTSSEFKHSREIRPLWLVERHGNAKNEPQPDDEPLPPLPASTVSSRNPSVEDLQEGASDEKSWEMVDLSRDINDNPGLAISTPSHERADLERGSESQQATPTKAAFGQEYASPPTSTDRKEKPKYEFHTPSELLRDPSTYAELPPTNEAPPSDEVNNDRDRELFPQGTENIPLPDSRPLTPQDKQIPAVDEAEMTTPKQDTNTTSDVLKGAGFAGVVGAAVAAAVDAGDHENQTDKPRSLTPVDKDSLVEVENVGVDVNKAVLPDAQITEPTPALSEPEPVKEEAEAGPVPPEISVPVSDPVATSDEKGAVDGTSTTGMGAIVDAAVAEATGSTSDQPGGSDEVQQREIDVDPKTEAGEAVNEEPKGDILPSTSTADDKALDENETVPSQPEEAVSEPATSESSSKKSKKNKKKNKKDKSVDQTSEEQTESTSAPADEEGAGVEPVSHENETKDLGLEQPSADAPEQESAPTEARNVEDVGVPEHEGTSAPAAESAPEDKIMGLGIDMTPAADAVEPYSTAPEAVEGSRELEPEATPALAPASEPEPTSAAPEAVETTRELEQEAVPADDAEPAPTTSSKKSKRDKKKKKSKGGASEDQNDVPAPSDVGAAEGEISQPAEEPTKSEVEPTAEEPKESSEEKVAPTAPVEAEEPAQAPQEQESAPEPIQPSEQDDRGEPEASKELSQPTEEADMTTPAEPADAEVSPETTEGAKELDLAHEPSATETPADAKPETEGQTDTAPLTEPQPEPEAVIETAESAVSQEKSLDVTQGEQLAPEAPLDTETKPVEPEAEAPVQGGEAGSDGQIPESAPIDVDAKPETDGVQREQQPLEQERSGGAPEGESMPSDQPAPADPESDGTSLSRKSSKKNKKKNKRKSESAAETPAEQDPVASEPPQAEEVPSAETQPVVAGDEQPQDVKPEKSESRQVEEVPSTETEQPTASEEPSQDQKPEDFPQPIEKAEVPKQEDQPSEPTVEPTEKPDATEETQEEPTKKKKKNKKNRKSSALSESQPEPEPESEPKPEQQESVDTAETRQTGGEISTGDDNQAPPPETTATSGEPAGVQDVESAPAETDPPVEKSEANDGSPHVSAQSNVEPESAPEPNPASTPLNEQQGGENKDGVLTIPDEAWPEESSNTDVKDTDANVDVAPASEEPLPTPEPSKEEEQPFANEMSRDIAIDVPETQSQDAVEEEVPMTPAQKKKAKKEKNKKKRQSVSVEETPTSEAADAATAQQQEEGRDLPVSEAAPVEDPPTAQDAEKDNGTANEEPAAATATPADAEQMQEEPKDNAAASAAANVEAEAVNDEPVAPEPTHGEKAVDPEASPIATNEADPVETEPTQEKAEAGADVGTAATSDEPSAVETKPAEEPHEDATIGVEPTTTTESIQETPKDDVDVATDVNTTTEAPSTTDAGLEQAQTEDNAVDAAPTQDQVQVVTTEPAQEQQTIPEPDNASTDKSPEETQDPEPATSAKSKKNKKKKKKSQSASADEEQSTPAESEPTTPVIESPPEGGTVPEESSAVSDAAEKQTEAPTEGPTETPAEVPTEVSTEVPREVPTEAPSEDPVAKEATSADTPVTEAEPTEEAETPASKKKAKKDKKKRKSVTFDTEKPPGQPDEPVESESAQPAESTEPVEPVIPDTAAEVVEQKPDSSDVSAEQSPTAPDSASTDGLQINDTPLHTPMELIAPESEEKPTPAPEELEKEVLIDQAAKDEAAAPQEVESEEGKEDTKSDPEPLSTTSQPDSTPEAAEPEQPPAVESEPQTPITEGEQEPGSAKSKKNKKKKKKGKASEVDENTPSEPGNDASVESEKALDAGTNESKEESKEPEVATPEPKEPEPESTEPASEAPEVKEVQEPAQQPETPEQDTSSTSKSKKKAKKDKKRQSKALDSNDAAAAAADEKPTGPSLETATGPAEDYGKEHQSRDTENDAASNDKDLFWTDQIVSSQVEQQQQATPSDSKLDSEKVEDDSAPVPVTESGEAKSQSQADAQAQAAESGEPLETNDASTPVNEPEASGEIGTNADNELSAEVSEEKRDGNEDDGAGTVPVQEEEVANKDVPDEVVEQPVQAVNEDEKTTTEEPGTHSEAVVEDSKSDEPPAPNEEDLSPLTSGKKKKKDKKKNKKQQDDVQVEESQESPMDNAEPEPSEHQTVPDAEQPVEAEGNPPLSVEEPTRETLESAEEEPAKPPLEEAEAATDPAELSKNTTSQPQDFEAATSSKKKSKKDKKKNKKSQPEEQPEQESADAPLTPVDAPTSVPSGDQLDAPAEAELTEATSPPSMEKETESGQKGMDGSQTDLPRPSEGLQDTESGVEIPRSGESTDDTTIGEPTPGPTPLIGSEETPREMTGAVEDNNMMKGVEREELPSTQAETSERPPEMNEPAPTTELAADVDVGEPVEKSVSEVAPPLETNPEQATEQEKEKLPTTNEQAAPVEIPEEQEPSPAAQEAGEQHEAVLEPLSRKESKKKKKKAKKQSKDEEEPATPAPVEEVVPDVDSENAKGSSAAFPKESAVKEQVDDAPPAQEADVSTELPTGGEQTMTTREQVNEPKEEKEEEEAPLSRKLSKKEKRKAKQKAAESAEPATEERALEQEGKEKAGRMGDFNEQQVTKNPPPKQTTMSQAQETTSQRMKTHHQLAQDNDLWPEIDWTYNSADSKQQNSLPSPETRPVQAAPLEPAIGEFDETAVPEAVTPIPENDKIEPPVEATSPPQPKGSPEPKQEAEAPTVDEKPKEETDVPSRPLSRVESIFPHLERGGFRRPASKESLKDRAEEETMDPEVSRENAIQVSEAPITLPKQVQEEGERELPAMSTAEDPSFERSMTTESETPVTPVDVAMDKGGPSHLPDNEMMPLHAPLPLNEQSPAPVDFSPVQQEPDRKASRSPSCELQRSPSVVHGRHEQTPRSWTLEEDPAVQAPRTPSPAWSLAGETSPPRTPLHTIAEQEPEDQVGAKTMDSSRGTPRLEMKPEHVLPRPETPTPGRKFTDNALARQAWPMQEKEEHGDNEIVKNPKSRSSSQTPVEPPKTPEQSMPILKPSSVKSATTSMQNLQNTSPSVSRSLRRTTNRTPSVRSASGDLRAASRALENPQPPAAQPPQQPQPQPSPPSDFNVERIASSSSYDPVTDKGKRPVRGMTDVYEAWGETPNSPRSPSRPPSVRHRRSMQHLQDVETRLDQLISENRLLIAARDAAEDKLRKTSVARRKSDNALNRSDADLRDREAELQQWQESVQWHQKEVARLTDENDGLTTTNANLTAAHAQEIQAAEESSARQLEDLRSQYQQVTADMQDRVRYEVEQALSQKNADLRRLREELESARDKVKRLQEEIAASVHDGVLSYRDEDFFDAACQKLCGHVQQWVLRFSKHSDHRRCRRLGDLHDEKIADRFDNAILDGSDADAYLGDRVRRRDVFMSVVMTMVWEFIFTRYLFGMERDQRQKLKSLEKQLSEVGPRSAVHRWRATTLSLLSKRPSFSKQRENDTEAVAREIFSTLARLLPPPTQVENQLLESLRKVLRIAVSLSVEMRSQLAEYIMLPPLQPEYNTNGDLARLVYFNASLMNERSGQTTSNEELENQQLPVRIVLFPLVVKKGNDKGEGEEEVVVCPAQVLVARPAKDKQVSQMLSSDRMSLDANRSVHSAAPSSNMDVSNLI